MRLTLATLCLHIVASAHFIALIERQANAADSTQFICTTFWPEMVATADKVYATAYSNKVGESSSLAAFCVVEVII